MGGSGSHPFRRIYPGPVRTRYQRKLVKDPSREAFFVPEHLEPARFPAPLPSRSPIRAGARGSFQRGPSIRRWPRCAPTRDTARLATASGGFVRRRRCLVLDGLVGTGSAIASNSWLVALHGSGGRPRPPPDDARPTERGRVHVRRGSLLDVHLLHQPMQRMTARKAQITPGLVLHASVAFERRADRIGGDVARSDPGRDLHEAPQLVGEL